MMNTTESSSNTPPVDLLTRTIAATFHKFHDKARSGLQSVSKGEPQTVSLPIRPAIVVLAITGWAWVASYFTPAMSSAYWMGGLSANVVVGAGLLAFAPWFPEKIPNIMAAFTSAVVDAGLVGWPADVTEESASEYYAKISSTKRTWLTIRMSSSGATLLVLNIVGLVVVPWIPAHTQTSVTMALMMLTVLMLIGLVSMLYTLGAWPILWQIYRFCKDLHDQLLRCHICEGDVPAHPES